jgi:hypothetical protein
MRMKYWRKEYEVLFQAFFYEFFYCAPDASLPDREEFNKAVLDFLSELE